jgi:hypothetical protein
MMVDTTRFGGFFHGHFTQSAAGFPLCGIQYQCGAGALPGR